MGLSLLPQLITQMRSAYQGGGITDLCEAHRVAVSRSAFYRVISNLVDLFFPTSVLLDLASSIDRQVKELGLCRASNAVLDRLSIPWQAQFPQRGRETITRSSAIVYSNHPSVMAPVFIAASLDRPDLKIVAASYLGELGPNVARYVLPVKRTYRYSLGRADCGIVTRIVAARILDYLHPRQEKCVAQAHNQITLNAAVSHVLEGGGVVVFPQGGGRDSEKWFPGIGVLVSNLAQISPPSTTHLVPVRIENDSNTRIHGFVSQNPVLRLQGRLLSRGPIRVRFETPIPLDSLFAEQSIDPRIATVRLEGHYKTLFQSS